MYEYAVGERSPWGDFPPVISNAGLGALRRETEYVSAKQGSDMAALILVDRMLSDDVVRETSSRFGAVKPTLLPVLAIDKNGQDRIPLAMSCVLADRLGWDVEFDIIQIDKINRVGARPDHRIAFTPRFSGRVEAGKHYLILDDSLIMGGTIASLRGYVENRGGKVASAMVMTAHEDLLDIASTPKMTRDLATKHGPDLNAYFEENFGYGIDKLTRGEATYLWHTPSLDAIQNRIASTRNEGVRRLDEGRVDQTQEHHAPNLSGTDECENDNPAPSLRFGGRF